jgi:hypothetical protein
MKNIKLLMITGLCFAILIPVTVFSQETKQKKVGVSLSSSLIESVQKRLPEEKKQALKTQETNSVNKQIVKKIVVDPTKLKQIASEKKIEARKNSSENSNSTQQGKTKAKKEEANSGQNKKEQTQQQTKEKSQGKSQGKSTSTGNSEQNNNQGKSQGKTQGKSQGKSGGKN